METPKIIFSDDDEGRKLRLLNGGRLRVTRVQVKINQMLPTLWSGCWVEFSSPRAETFSPWILLNAVMTVDTGKPFDTDIEAYIDFKQSSCVPFGHLGLCSENELCRYSLFSLGTASQLVTWGAMSSWSWQFCIRWEHLETFQLDSDLQCSNPILRQCRISPLLRWTR